MQDEPTPPEMLAAVAALLRETVMPQLSGHTAFLVRVAANALDLVRRQVELEPTADAAELARLRRLLGRDGALLELNQALCEAIETGKMGLETPGLTDHLWSTTLEKLAIDQPSYAPYQRAVER
ncbi:MAG: protein kinase [Caulobacteraceae bacterium]|nr:protein kinase [Caulobacteraceae bacterium]